jgi:hypothetical protein
MAIIRRTLYEVDGANRMLPLVRAIVGDVVAEFRRLRSAGREQRILESDTDGDGSSMRRIHDLRVVVTECSTRVEGYLHELEELGLELRDLETGLVDFPTLMYGEPAFLCWKPGESEVLWWHAAGQGFADRQPIPRVERVALPAETSPTR